MNSIINFLPQDEQDQMHQIKLKTDRFYFIESEGWYFHCREGKLGPFKTQPIAKRALTVHIDEQ